MPRSSPLKNKQTTQEKTREHELGLGLEFSWLNKERFLLFLGSGHFKETQMWISSLKTAAASLCFWLVPVKQLVQCTGDDENKAALQG